MEGHGITDFPSGGNFMVSASKVSMIKLAGLRLADSWWSRSRRPKPGTRTPGRGRIGHRRGRSRAGVNLVEILVSLLVGSIMAGVMVDMFSKMQRVGGTSQNELSANCVAQELLDMTRSLDYNFLSQYQGTSLDLYSNRSSAGQVGTVIRNDPTLLDFVNKTWSTKVMTSGFTGTANYRIDPSGTLPQTLKVTVTVNYSDSENIGTSSSLYGRSITTSTLVSRSGVNLWTL